MQTRTHVWSRYFKVYYTYYKAEVIAAFDSGLYMPGSYNLMMLEK